MPCKDFVREADVGGIPFVSHKFGPIHIVLYIFIYARIRRRILDVVQVLLPMGYYRSIIFWWADTEESDGPIIPYYWDGLYCIGCQSNICPPVKRIKCACIWGPFCDLTPETCFQCIRKYVMSPYCLIENAWKISKLTSLSLFEFIRYKIICFFSKTHFDYISYNVMFLYLFKNTPEYFIS